MAIVVTGGSGRLGQAILRGLLIPGAIINLDRGKLPIGFDSVMQPRISSLESLFSGHPYEFFREPVSGLLLLAGLDATPSGPRVGFEEYLDGNLTLTAKTLEWIEPVLEDDCKVVTVASLYALVAPDPRLYPLVNDKPAGYGAAKAGVIALTKWFAARHPRMSVNCLIPGGIEGGQSQEFKDKFSARTIMGRMGRADELVGPCLFLLGPGASYMTGQTLVVDGGYTAL